MGNEKEKSSSKSRREFIGFDRLLKTLKRDDNAESDSFLQRGGITLTRSSFIASGIALTSSAIGLGLAGCSKREEAHKPAIAEPQKETLLLELPEEFNLPERKSFSDIEGEFTTFSDFMEAVVERGLLQRGDIGLAEALLYMAKDSVNLGLTEEFNFESYQERIYGLASEMANELVSTQPKTPIEAVDVLNSVFFSHLKARSREEYGDTATINEVFDMGNGYCEDLVGVYMSCVQIMERGGINLPIRAVLAPSHILACWENEQGSADFYIEMTASGEIVQDTKPYQRSLEYDPRRTKGYFIPMSIEVALASELNNRGVALGSKVKRRYDEALQDAKWAVAINPTAGTYLNLGSSLDDVRGQDLTDETIEAYKRSIEYDPTGRTAHSSLADAYVSKARDIRDDSEKDERVRLLKDAEKSYENALKNPEKKLEGKRTEFFGYNPYTNRALWIELADVNLMIHESTGDLNRLDTAVDYFSYALENMQSISVFEKRSNALEQRYDASGNLEDLDKAIKDWTGSVTLHELDEENNWALGNVYFDRARLHMKRHKRSDDSNDLDNAIEDYTKALSPRNEWDQESYRARRGIAHALRGNFDEALGDFNFVISKTDELDKDRVHALLGRALVYVKQGKKDNAKQDMGRVWKVYKKFKSASNLGELVERVGQIEEYMFDETAETLQYLQQDAQTRSMFDEIIVLR